MSGFIDPEIDRTFRPHENGFISRSVGRAGAPIPSPLWTIARIAQHRVVVGAEIDLSHITLECGDQVLGECEERYSYPDIDVYISSVRAVGLAEIGRQILVLNKQGSIQPPLRNSEIHAIGHLVTTVDQVTAH